tara:strand:- start:205 stop:438 length:234 start_codon:yes stop_codon:yes gene_type:complete
LSIEKLKQFLTDIQENKILLEKVSNVGTAAEIVSIANEFGYEFSVNELKSASEKSFKGVKIKKQDTSPSYNFGESGN